MTTVNYKVTTDSGKIIVVASRQQAEDIVAEEGGTITQTFDSTISQSEAYARRGYRNPGSQT